tara:strand:+ start:1796 stop:2515 length:720 start_codon:yes stop_codon:yes gene_type:complete
VDPAKIFHDLIHNKKVALVGPGRTTTDNYKKVEDADTVVRCGLTIPVLPQYKKFYGYRTDIVYNSLDNCEIAGGLIQELIPIWKKESIKLVCNTYPTDEYFYPNSIAPHNNKVSNYFPVKKLNSDLYFSYKNKLNSRPNSGFCAFMDVFNMSPKSLYIVGIDFFRSLAFDRYKGSIGGWTHKDFKNDMDPGYSNNHHHPDKQFKVFKNMCSKFPEIEVDPYIQQFFDDSKYDNLFGELS